MNIDWEDSDKKKTVLFLKDEKSYVEKLPHSDLFKTTVKINFNSVKVITITLFYTTQTCLVQGNIHVKRGENRSVEKLRQ